MIDTTKYLIDIHIKRKKKVKPWEKHLLIDRCDRHLIADRNVFLSAGYPTIVVGYKKLERLHRIVAGAPAGFEVDHKNHNKLDMRRKNLRVCTKIQNKQNVGPRVDSVSGIRGVWFDVARGKWAAQITAAGVRYVIGRFDSKRKAVSERKKKEKELWGEFAPA